MKDLRAQHFPDHHLTDSRGSHMTTGRWFFNTKGLTLDSVSTRIAYDSAPVAIALCDLSCRVVHGNHALKEFLRAESLESLIGKDLAYLCAPFFDVDFLEELAIDGQPRQQIFASTARATDMSGQILCNARRIEGEENSPRWLVITFNELRKQGAYANTAANNVDSSLLERLAGIAYWQITVDCDDNIEDLPISWSGGLTALVNTQQAGKILHLRDWLALVSQTDRPSLQEALLQLASHGQQYDMEYELSRHIGHARKLRSRAWRVAHPTLAGSYLLIGMEQDLSPATSLEQQLQSAIQTFKSLFDINDSLACAVDHRLRLMYGNPAFQTTIAQHLGYSTNSGINLRDLFSTPKIRRGLINNLRRALAGEHRIQTVQFFDTSQTSNSFDLSFNPIISDNGQCIGVSMCGHKLASQRVTSLRGETTLHTSRTAKAVGE